MLRASPLDACHDVPLIVTNSAAGPVEVQVEWGANCRGVGLVPPGEHDADELGLFYNLMPTEPASAAPTRILAPTVVRLGGDIALTRRTVPDGVRVEVVEDDGLRGLLFTPPDPRRDMAIISLSGSGGGYAPHIAAALSRQGYVTLALAYFGIPGLPADLVRIPLEYPRRGIDWLYERSHVDKVCALGGSKGGELALLLGATFPEVRAVVAYVPSSQTQPWRLEDFVSCWTYDGRDLPWTKMDFSRNPPPVEGRYTIRPGYESTLDDPDEVERTAIPIENTNGPILLISGGQDAMWPSSEFSRRVVQRARQRRFAHEVLHLDYPEAGHAIGLPNLPRTPSPSAVFEMGGTPRETARASRQSWAEVLAFLGRQAGARD